jgi:isoleucyl-tRNA synthetase
MITSVQKTYNIISVLDLDEVYFLAWTTTYGLCHRIQLDCRSKIDYVLVKRSINIHLSLTNVVLAKNLVGKQFGKGFYESKDLTDFENYKEGDKIPPDPC